MIAHLPIFAVLIYLLISSAHGQQRSPEEVAKQYLAAMEQSKLDARSLNSTQIYDELRKTQQVLRLKNGSSRSTVPDLTDPGHAKAAALLSILEERRKASEPSAAYYYGMFELNLCAGLKESKSAAEVARDTCNSAADSFRVAVSANDPRAMRALGYIYRDGLGVGISKFVAADWFVKSARQYQLENSRESTLSALEDALSMVPDHPGALGLRKEMLK